MVTTRSTRAQAYAPRVQAQDLSFFLFVVARWSHVLFVSEIVHIAVRYPPGGRGEQTFGHGGVVLGTVVSAVDEPPDDAEFLALSPPRGERERPDQRDAKRTDAGLVDNLPEFSNPK